MTANVLAARQAEDNEDMAEESASVSSQMLKTVVTRVEEILGRIHGTGYEGILKLAKLPGEPEVDFLLPLGAWHIKGRFDKLLAHPGGGWEIVDWKTASIFAV